MRKSAKTGSTVTQIETRMTKIESLVTKNETCMAKSKSSVTKTETFSKGVYVLTCRNWFNSNKN